MRDLAHMRALVLSLCLATAGALPSASAAAAAAPVAAKSLEVHVIGVIDGDSLKVRDSNGLEHEVRIAAIDAPEHTQPFSRQAATNLARMALDKDARLELQPKRDRHGRLVAQVWVIPPDVPCSTPECPKTLDVGHAQIISGLAWHYKRYEKYQSPQDRGAYSSDEEEARLRRRGLWADPHPVPPEDWRRGLENGPIKKSNAGICHSPQMPSYPSVEHFTSYATMEACVASGGRPPKPN
jgi:endonuclease YncB( thermonuclease family)